MKEDGAGRSRPRREQPRNWRINAFAPSAPLAHTAPPSGSAFPITAPISLPSPRPCSSTDPLPHPGCLPLVASSLRTKERSSRRPSTCQAILAGQHTASVLVPSYHRGACARAGNPLLQDSPPCTKMKAPPYRSMSSSLNCKLKGNRGRFHGTVLYNETHVPLSRVACLDTTTERC